MFGRRGGAKGKRSRFLICLNITHSILSLRHDVPYGHRRCGAIHLLHPPLSPAFALKTSVPEILVNERLKNKLPNQSGDCNKQCSKG